MEREYLGYLDPWYGARALRVRNSWYCEYLGSKTHGTVREYLDYLDPWYGARRPCVARYHCCQDAKTIYS
jgi:hypothetical protein